MNNDREHAVQPMDVDDDEEEEEEEEEETDSENEQAPPPAVVPENGEAIEGGVAEPLEPGKARRKSTEADITLFLTCSEALPFFPDHPVLKPGVTVQIGMGKTSLLRTVFQRYVEVCNDLAPFSSVIDLNDLEFVHSVVLNENDNAEAAALMKNDRISVRPDSERQRLQHEERHSIQRESDRKYFSALRSHLLVKPSGDTYLRCEDGGVIEFHSFIVRKRCRWLGKLVDDAMCREMGRQSIITVPGSHEEVKAVDPSVAHIENDEDEPCSAEVEEKPVRNVWVNLDHPVAAAKILLEYCYTNRVHSLGLNAFIRSNKTTLPAHLAPVPPFSVRRWPHNGLPNISLSTALSAIKLAREANMPRLLLQCEIAASELVDADTAVEALSASRELPTLRLAATQYLLHSAEELDDLDIPKQTLPIVLAGVAECVGDRSIPRRKRSPPDPAEQDAMDREEERCRHRRTGHNAY